jgi:hypothetical protein
MALEGKSIMHRSIQVFQINAEVNAEVGQIEASEMSRAAVSNKTFPGVARRFGFLLTPCIASEYVEFRENSGLEARKWEPNDQGFL